MATVVADPTITTKLSARTKEHWFFCGMSLVIALVVLVGFARTYFLASYFHAKPLAAPIVHVHAAVFTGWILLLLAQTSLAASGNVAVHRRLGLVGMGLAPLVFVLGMIVAREMLGRLSGVPEIDATRIYAVALSEIAGFALPVFFALRLRRRPDYHKRLILIGTIAMMTAGFGRWPVKLLLHQPLPAMICTLALLGLVIAYDLLSLGKVHRTTLLGSAWVMSVELLSLPLSRTTAWHAFAAWSH
jgi:hypothetical protein